MDTMRFLRDSNDKCEKKAFGDTKYGVQCTGEHTHTHTHTHTEMASVLHSHAVKRTGLELRIIENNK